MREVSSIPQATDLLRNIAEAQAVTFS